LGERVDIGAFCLILAQHGVTIEDDVQIGSHCTIHSADTERGVFGPVVLKKGCLIGAGTKIYPNVTIGYKASVGANCVINANIGHHAEVKAMSLVLKDVPPRWVVAGSPARRLVNGLVTL